MKLFSWRVFGNKSCKGIDIAKALPDKTEEIGTPIIYDVQWRKPEESVDFTMRCTTSSIDTHYAVPIETEVIKLPRNPGLTKCEYCGRKHNVLDTCPGCGAP